MWNASILVSSPKLLASLIKIRDPLLEGNYMCVYRNDQVRTSDVTKVRTELKDQKKTDSKSLIHFFVF